MAWALLLLITEKLLVELLFGNNGNSTILGDCCIFREYWEKYESEG
ncbi:unnamed protein product [Schistosoma curassoni]|uniref:Uncharacterized protein n=1 Tax=Schistosoma curassoni TaxID=6186 RepID=A0A183KQ58_9TREM|nr:unnamed protein product [Schistosoma curassoni]